MARRSDGQRFERRPSAKTVTSALPIGRRVGADGEMRVSDSELEHQKACFTALFLQMTSAASSSEILLS